MLTKLELICPDCRDALTYVHSKNLLCSRCKTSYELLEDIPILTRNTKYYGDFNESEMDQLLKDLDNSSWEEVIYQWTKDNPWLRTIISDQTRSDFVNLLDVTQNSLVLDIGSGWGNSAIGTAKSTGASVIALDGTWHRLRFVQKRAAQEKVSTLDFVCANVLKLPFREEIFDFAIMSGVLEWVGTSVEKGDPSELQEQALSEVCRVLKPTGQLLIGIENSHGFKYLLGAPDDHTGIKHITYLSRDAANKKMQSIRGCDYRTYTYTMDGYSQLLKRAGFNYCDFFYPIPDYKTCSYIIPLRDTRALRFFLHHIDAEKPKASMQQEIRIREMQAIDDGTIGNRVSSYFIVAHKMHM